MSNRTDFQELAKELATDFDLSIEAQERIETELHNAHVAGQEHHDSMMQGYWTSECECRWCKTERAHALNPVTAWWPTPPPTIEDQLNEMRSAVIKYAHKFQLEDANDLAMQEFQQLLADRRSSVGLPSRNSQDAISVAPLIRRSSGHAPPCAPGTCWPCARRYNQAPPNDTVRPMSFDPTTNAATLAALQARVDTTFPMQSAKFTLAQNTTQRIKGDSYFQGSMPVNPNNARTAIAWSAVYRGKVLVGTLIVCNVADVPMATAMLLTEAVAALDAMDLKLLTEGSPEALYPSTAPGFR